MEDLTNTFSTTVSLMVTCENGESSVLTSVCIISHSAQRFDRQATLYHIWRTGNSMVTVFTEVLSPPLTSYTVLRCGECRLNISQIFIKLNTLPQTVYRCIHAVYSVRHLVRINENDSYTRYSNMSTCLCSKQPHVLLIVKNSEK